MLKIFLVEDESIVREGLRDNIPWQQYGYRFAGEANDGEMALPMIRKIQPDVLITDIKMPFMDGLALSRIVGQEFPNMKIIIISGYDEFEYARQAIQMGVEQYLLKPITRANLQKVLNEVREKIESEREQKNYLEKFQNEMHEYEQFSRRNFFEKVFEGKLSVQEIYEEAQKLSLEINASCYNLVMVSLQEKKKSVEERGMDSEAFARKQDELLRFFLRYPEYLVFRWNISTFGVLIKTEEGQVEIMTKKCMDSINQICTNTEMELEWYAVEGKPVERLSMLTECYSRINHILSYRFFTPSKHILSEQAVEELIPGEEDEKLEDLDVGKLNPEILKDFLTKGLSEETEEFVTSYLQSIGKALKSKLFRDYFVLNIRFSVIAFVESMGISQNDFFESVNVRNLQELSLWSEDDLHTYMKELLEHAIELRDRENESRSKKILQKAMEYIEENYAQESLSLNKVASITNVSANYFSAMFSQVMEMTFTEYVTQKRMEKAKKLLRQSDKHSGDIALEVGYKDPHYFSFVFKKTQGCSPREYRNEVSSV